MTSTVLITGASGRIGSGVATHLAKQGYDLALHYYRGEESAKDVAEQVSTETGRRVEVFQANLFDNDETLALIPRINDALGPVDVLINNASIFEPDRFEDTDESKFDQNMAIHAKAPFFLMQAMAKQTEDGAVINIIDTYITRVTERYVPYLLSKKTLFAINEMAARSLAPKIRVNGIALGMTEFNDNIKPEYIETRIKRSPLNNVVKLEHIAETITFLLHQRAMTGGCIFLDNGDHLL